MPDREWPKRVPEKNRPTIDAQSAPLDVAEAALSIALDYDRFIDYGSCPHCGSGQFYPVNPGHNIEWDCRVCGETMDVIG